MGVDAFGGDAERKVVKGADGLGRELAHTSNIRRESHKDKR
jgi:hypothetical protein